MCIYRRIAPRRVQLHLQLQPRWRCDAAPRSPRSGGDPNETPESQWTAAMATRRWRKWRTWHWWLAEIEHLTLEAVELVGWLASFRMTIENDALGLRIAWRKRSFSPLPGRALPQLLWWNCWPSRFPSSAVPGSSRLLLALCNESAGRSPWRPLHHGEPWPSAEPVDLVRAQQRPGELPPSPRRHRWRDQPRRLRLCASGNAPGRWEDHRQPCNP